MVGIDFSEFKHKRARLQRISDARFFSGWVDSVSASEVIVRITGGVVLDISDEFMVEVHGLLNLMGFRGRVESFEDSTTTLRIITPMQLTPVTEDARVTITNLIGHVTIAGEVHEFEVVDISVQGIGILVGAPLNRKSVAEISIDTETGPIRAQGIIRYCREDAENIGAYRAGIEFGEMGRVEKARLKSPFLQSAA